MRVFAILLSLTLGLMSSAGVRGASITELDPPFGSVNDQIKIRGSGFSTGVVTIKFWNGVVASATPTSDTILYAIVPNGAQSGAVSVQINGGAPSYSSTNFVVVPTGQPYIHTFTPNFGSGQVTISGANINVSSVQVRFNEVLGTVINYVNPPNVIATPPANFTTGPIRITTPSGSYTTTNLYYAQPGVSKVSPFRGRYGTNVLVTGQNLLGTTSITFGGVPATSFNVASNGALTVTVPTNAPTGLLQVFAPGGNFPVSSNFIIEPTVFGFSPTNGPVGTPVLLTGANLSEGGTNVWFNGTKATIVTNVSFNQVTAVVPTGATTGPIGLATTNGGFTNLTAFFYVPARITGFTPTNSAPGTQVVISGQNFLGASAVTFNGTPAAFATPTNNTTLVATVPEGFTTGPISISTPAGTTNSGTLFFYGLPLISSFSPTNGLPGTNVVLTGQSFLGTTAVRFNGVSASFTPPTNNTTLVATVPVGAQTGPISVVAPAGTNSSAQNFVLDYRSNLRVIGTAMPDPVTVTSNLVYTLQVSNLGPHAAPSVKLTNHLPASVAVRSVVFPGGSLETNGTAVVGTLPLLGSGDSVTMTLQVAPNVAGSVTNLVEAGSGYVDTDLANNSLILVTTVYPLPLLSITKVPVNRFRISWPVEWTNYGLQYSSNLLETNGWSNITSAPIVSGPERFILETNSQPMRFYRLKQ